MAAITLTEKQQTDLIELFEKTQDADELTQLIFDNKELTAKSPEGIAIRRFLGQKGKLQVQKKKEEIEFTADQKAAIKKLQDDGKSTLDIAISIFPDRHAEGRIVKLCREQKAVIKYIKDNNIDYQFNSYKTTPPIDGEKPNYLAGYKRLIGKINNVSTDKVKEDVLTKQQEISLEKLQSALNSSRIATIMDNYENIEDKELFEAEFIKLVWGKHDLTPDDMHLYIAICKEIVMNEHTTKELSKLRRMFDEIEEANDINIRMSEMISTKNNEYHQSSKRIEDLLKKLSGSREERQKKKREENSSILVIIQAFQDETERKRMIDISEKQKRLVRTEAEKLESLDSWKARIMGVTIDDVV
jgi:arsenate reductase-like glutaredoxin family protein